ncbi:uncharacterized protein LOC100371124 [Saccoglossus kowalevskii]|uniref:Uncharacterized protein LOC100371124 n=1 Tax=Saccoglossus kowalevskii TaxID=10224 RepID=A0ABM0GUP9_SACKO|nr:PREDICTED: uncharacterized protein LOC100371124 [Saccoglossus kowalevskii]
MAWMKTKLVMGVICVLHLLQVRALDADLEMTHVIVNSVDDIIPLDTPSGLFPVVNFKNSGPTSINEASGENLNFELKAYLSSVNGRPDASSYILGDIGNLSQSVDSLRRGISVDHTIGITLFDVDIEIPSSVCDWVKYFCVEVQLLDTTGLVDRNPNNNYACKLFDLPISMDDRIGKFLCYIDIASTAAKVTDPADLEYLAGTSYDVTFETSITNYGGIPLGSPPSGQHNLKPIVFLTDSDQLEDATFSIEQPAIITTYDDTVDPNENITLGVFTASITIPLDEADCLKITHVCVEIVGDRDYGEEYPDNNDYCLMFGPVDEGKAGKKYGCPADGVDLQIESFEVVDYATVIYNIGRDTDIEINAIIKNVGDTAIEDSTPTGPINYEFDVYFINHRSDFDSSTDTLTFTADYTSATNMKVGLSYGNVLSISQIATTTNLPADTARCTAYQSVCLRVREGSNAPYDEDVTDNNILCNEFDTVVGHKDCPDLDIDIEPVNMTVTPVTDPYPLDTPVDTTIEIGITNIGPGNLPDVADPEVNYVVKVFLSDSDELENANLKIEQTSITTDDNQLRQGLVKDGIIDISLNPAVITLPENDCYDLLYICVEISLHPDSIYIETNPDTNDFCVQFGPQNDGKAGETECFIDIAATSVEVTSPQDLTYKPGIATAIQIQLSVDNNGGVTLDEMTEMAEYNFVPLILLTDNDDLARVGSPIEAVVISGGFTQEVTGKTSNLTLSPKIDVEVIIPTERDQCEKIRYLCLEIFHSVDVYVDTDASNDFKCIEFGAISEGKAGIIECNITIDLSANNLVVAPEVPKYDFDVDTDVELSVDLTNNGAGDIPQAIGERPNFNVRAYITDSANLEAASLMIEQDLNYDQETLSGAIDNGDLLTLLTDQAILNIPLDRCLEISHICVIVTLADDGNSVFWDPDLTNNDACLGFGLITEGYAGVIPCFIDLAAINLKVISPRNLRYLVGVPTEVEVQLTVHNYGALTLPHAPEEAPNKLYNFKPEMFITNGNNLDTASMVDPQDDVEKTFKHEVASGVTVILVSFMITVKIPEETEDCRDVSHLCIRINDNNFVYVDGYAPNDNTCTAFGDVRDGKAGLYTCLGDEIPDGEERSGLPIAYTIGIVVVVVIAVLIGITVAICNGCKKRNPKYMTA